MPLRHVDQCVESRLFRTPPPAFVHEPGITHRDFILQFERAPIEDQLLEFAVRRVEQGTARRFVDAPRLEAHDPVLDQVYPPHTVSAADLVQLLEQGERRHALAVD